MNRYSRYVLIIFAAVTILLLGFVVYIAAIFDPNAHKPRIIQLVKDKKQRELKLDGDIKLTFFPTLGAEFNNLALSEHRSSKEFAVADRVLVSLAILPLLRKELELNELRIMGLKADLIRFKDGNTNIDDLLAKDEEPSQFKLDIGQVLVEKTTLAFTDEASGAHFVFKDLDLKADMTDGRSGSIENDVRSKVDLGFSFNQSEQAGINLMTRLTFGLTLDTEKRRYAVKGLQLKSEGQVPGFNHVVINSTGDLSATLVKGPTNEFVADKLTLDITGVSAAKNFDIKLDAPRLSLTGESIAGAQVVAMVNIASPEASTKGKFVLAGLEGTVNDFMSRELTAELELAKGELAVKMMLASPLTGSGASRQLHLPNLKGVIHASDPHLHDGGISATLVGIASVDGSSENAQAEITGKFADSNIKAKLAAVGFTPPGFTFEMDIDQLDLDRFLSMERRPVEPAKISKNKIATQSLDLSALDDLNIQGSVRIGLLKTTGSRATGVKLNVKSE